MEAAHLPSDFKEFLKLLLEHQVEYLLVGGYAVAYHGYPRSTADIDIWINSERQNAQRLISALREFGFHTPDMTTDLFLKHDHIIQIGIAPNRIEIFTSLPGVEFEECVKNQVLDDLDGIEVKIIDLINLRRNKSATGRHKDLDDLENLPLAD